LDSLRRLPELPAPLLPSAIAAAGRLAAVGTPPLYSLDLSEGGLRDIKMAPNLQEVCMAPTAPKH
jgi:hypothetical protein